MHLRYATKFLSQQLWHLPIVGEYTKCCAGASRCLLQDALEPSKSALGVLKTRIGFAWCERFLVRLQELAAELDSKFIHSVLSNCIKGIAGLAQLLPETSLVDPTEVFEDLKSQLFAKPFFLLFDFSNLLCVLHVVLKVV